MIVVGLCVVGVAVFASTQTPVQKAVAGLFKNQASQLIKYKVSRGKLPVTIVERGNLESAKNTDVQNEVEGQTTIISILPEGKEVKKGDLVCELDSATLRDNLINQEITTRRAKADLDNAEKNSNRRRDLRKGISPRYVSSGRPNDRRRNQARRI